MTTQDEYIERWEQCLRVLESMTPHEIEKHFDMSIWGEKTECGTVGCAAGHCSLDPWFIERGFSSVFQPGGLTGSGLDLIFDKKDPCEFFGEVGYDAIFLSSCRSHEKIVRKVKDHIKFLKQGGNPNFESDWNDGNWDDDDDD